MHSMVMTVMKDSVESATPVKEVNYPEPSKETDMASYKTKLRPEQKSIQFR